MSDGYLRQPSIHGDQVAFVCQADLWVAPVAGGVARRLTSTEVDVSSPRFSPDGAQIAFVAQDEGGTEVFVMPAQGGQPRRLTFQGARCVVCGWSEDGQRVLYASDAEQAIRRGYQQWSVPAAGGAPERNPWGPADRIAYGPGGKVVIGRNTGDPARWKRYKGGTAGDLWVDPQGDGTFQRLLRLEGNLACPMWVGERVAFLSDHEGHGNVYSCTPSGEDLIRHTHHEDFYARNATTDGARVVYQSGGRLFVVDLAGGDAPREVEVQVHAAQPQTLRKFVSAGEYLEWFHLHPRGHKLALNARGKAFSCGNWEGAVRQHGARDGVRYRLTSWLREGESLVTLSDEGGEEVIEVHAADGSVRRLEELEVGRVLSWAPSPKADAVVLSNHRYELIHVDLSAGVATVLDTSRHERIDGLAWSPDGAWVAYGFPTTSRTTALKLVELATGATHTITTPVHRDFSPSFDPEGKYLYFLSSRTFDPVYDKIYFDLGFPRSVRPYLIALAADTPDPFRPEPKPLDGGPVDASKGAKDETKDEKDEKEEGKGDAGETKDDEAAKDAKDAKEADAPTRIDLEGIETRMLGFPVKEAIYSSLEATKGRVFFLGWPVEGSLGLRRESGPPEPKGVLKVYDFEAQKEDVFAGGVSGFELSMDGKTLAYLSGSKLRVVKSAGKPGKDDGCSRAGGWIDLGRVRVSVVPEAEWRQMYREAWRLQRDHFWSEDMSQIEWTEVFERYLPVLARVATRSEFSDLMWEVQGELGTSHAYEMGGDRPSPPPYGPGYLGADLRWRDGAWHVERLLTGDPWDERAASPLRAPGLSVREGDRLVSLDGVPLDEVNSPHAVLVHRAGQEVEVEVARGEEPSKRITVKTSRDETLARYRDWVEGNRRTVHEASQGEVGYVHVPDMGPRGFAEFHRYYLAEAARNGLLVDVRYNGGGHVSQLLLEKLARRRVGYDVPRHGDPVPYPEDSVRGPVVALTNEHAGSDGDIFSHCFKLMKIGPLVGTRTWGGVVGIWPRHPLVDRTVTTQAEFAFWFEDVGFAVENYGTDPDHVVEIAPQDYARGADPQLERALEVLHELLPQAPAIPDFAERPSRRAPRLSHG